MADEAAPEVLAGTSGFSYAAWKGPFYPSDLASGEMLRFYAEHLPAVEINNTFYRMPRAGVLASWAEQVPATFRFALKASRRITHFKRLKDAGDETRFLLRSLETLGERLGALLFQLPPQVGCDLGRLDAFLELLPRGLPAAFEFRHPSWRDDTVLARLRARDFAWVSSDDEGGEEEPDLVETASWGYLRLRRARYERADLAAWSRRIETSGWGRAFVFLKHEDAGAAPRMAELLLELARRGRMRSQAASARPRAAVARRKRDSRRAG